MDLIPAELRAQLRQLQLRSRSGVHGAGSGRQQSRERGAGMEFLQYRPYQPGDEPRQIDWRLYARSDRAYVREAERDSPLALWLVVDASASMGQADRVRPDYSRLRAAIILAACLIELALAGGDRFGLAVLTSGRLQLHTLGGGPRQRDRCLLALSQLEADGELPAVEACEPLWARTQAGHLVVCLSDGFDPTLLEVERRLAGAGREVIDLQLLTAEERDFPYREGHRFVDPETGTELEADGPAARAEFLASFEAAQRERRERLNAVGVTCLTQYLDRSLIDALRSLCHQGPG
jgi:uncharacterized protein (DUF58 family)